MPEGRLSVLIHTTYFTLDPAGRQQANLPGSFSSIGNSSGFPIEEKNNDAQFAGLMFIAAQSARARRMRIAHSFLSYRTPESLWRNSV